MGYNLCTNEAYWAYQKAFDAGDDGRPDWIARKSCNYMTAAVDECTNMLVGKCNTNEEGFEKCEVLCKGVEHGQMSCNESSCCKNESFGGRRTIQANCKLPGEENIDDESGDSSG